MVDRAAGGAGLVSRCVLVNLFQTARTRAGGDWIHCADERSGTSAARNQSLSPFASFVDVSRDTRVCPVRVLCRVGLAVPEYCAQVACGHLSPVSDVLPGDDSLRGTGCDRVELETDAVGVYDLGIRLRGRAVIA